MKPNEVTREELSAGQRLASERPAPEPPALRESAPEPSARQADRPPLWVPYHAPPPVGWRARAASWVRRYGFAVLLVAFAGALAALLLRSPGGQGGGAAPGDVAGGSQGAVPSATGALSGTALISVETQPAGATVFVDGEPVGVTPLRQQAVPAGVHMISVQKNRYAPIDTLVTLRNDAVPAFVLSLTPQPQQPSGEGAALAAGTPGASADAASAESASTDAAQQQQQGGGTAAQEETTGATGGLRIISEPSGAVVFLDGQRAGTTPLTVSGAPAGAHTITFDLDGYTSHTREITVAAGRTRTIRRTLLPATGTLKLRVEARGAVVHVDGQARPRQANGTYAVALSPGRHHLIVTHPDLGTWEQHVTLGAGETRSLTVDFGRSRSRRGW